MSGAKDESLYKLIASQLRYDGFNHVAVQLESQALGSSRQAPLPRLAKYVTDAMAVNTDTQNEEPYQSTGERSMKGINLDDAFDAPVDLKLVNSIKTVYTAVHKGGCLAAAFSPDGQFAATASMDSSIKLLDTQRLMKKFDQNDSDIKRVLKTFYDHTQPVQALAFHPQSSILVAGGLDNTVKLFDYQKLSFRRATKTISESHAVNALVFHPGGDYLLVGTAHSVLRMYDMNNLTCFSSKNTREFHQGGISAVDFSPNGSVYASGSADGTIKLWDGISSRCINTIKVAHSGREVDSVKFSKNGKYLLSSGRDNTCKLWEISSGRDLVTYGEAGFRMNSSTAVFGPSEDFVLGSDDKSNAVVVWNSRTGEKLKSFVGHQQPIRALASSPNAPGFFSCSDDFRARFWAYKQD
eukprot:CFRG3761T1